MTDPKTEARLPRDLVTILRTEARNQRTPPIDYAIAEDGLRMVVRPEPDIAMAELLEEAAERIAALEAAWIIKDPIEGDIRDYHEGVVKSLMDTINHLKNQLTAKDAELAEMCAYAFEATKAITSLTVGGSEFFGKRIGEMYTADLPYCVEHIKDRERRAHKRWLEEREKRQRAEAQLAEARKALDALDRMSRGVDWCDQDEQARRWSAARRALEEQEHGR